jgi:hypothetical protein
VAGIAAQPEQAAAWGKDITQPTLYLHGTQDGCHGMTQEQVNRVPGHCGPGSQSELIDGVGHFLMVQRPTDINKRILESWPHSSRPGHTGQVTGRTANTPRSIRTRWPRSCYPFCMISPIGEISPEFVFKSPSDTYYFALTCGFTIRVPASAYKAAYHEHGGASPSRIVPISPWRTAQVQRDAGGVKCRHAN